MASHRGLRQQGIHHTDTNPTMVAALILATCLASTAFAQKGEAKKEYRFTVGPHPNISVDTQNGAISVKPGSGNQVVVTATVKSDNVEVDRQQKGNRVDIASHVLQGTGQQTWEAE